MAGSEFFLKQKPFNIDFLTAALFFRSRSPLVSTLLERWTRMEMKSYRKTDTLLFVKLFQREKDHTDAIPSPGKALRALPAPTDRI